MSPQLDFTPLDDEERASGRSRDRNPTMQMSVRMREEVYERFRDHCLRERYTNGEMLKEMMEAWERERKIRAKD